MLQLLPLSWISPARLAELAHKERANRLLAARIALHAVPAPWYDDQLGVPRMRLLPFGPRQRAEQVVAAMQDERARQQLLRRRVRRHACIRPAQAALDHQLVASSCHGVRVQPFRIQASYRCIQSGCAVGFAGPGEAEVRAEGGQVEPGGQGVVAEALAGGLLDELLQ